MTSGQLAMALFNLSNNRLVLQSMSRSGLEPDGESSVSEEFWVQVAAYMGQKMQAEGGG